MGRKREYDREGMDAAVRVLINSGELTNPIEGVPFIYDVTPWFETKDNGRTDETTAAELYTMAEGDKCFGTYVEAEDSYKTERGFVTGLISSGYVVNEATVGFKPYAHERTEGRYYLWAAEGADGTMYNSKDITSEMIADVRNIPLGVGYIASSYYGVEIKSDPEATTRTEFNIPDTSDRKATQHLADEVLASADYLTYLPADDPLRIQGEEAVHAAQDYKDSLYPATEFKGWTYHKAGDTKWEYNVGWQEVGVYEQDEKIPQYRTVYRSSMDSADIKEMNAGARSYLNAANEQDLVETAHEAITANMHDTSDLPYELRVSQVINFATSEEYIAVGSLDLDDFKGSNLIEGYRRGSEVEKEIREQSGIVFQGYAQNFMDRIDYVVPNGEKPDDTTLPGYDAYAEKKAEYVEKQTDEIVHSTIREANKEVTGSRDAVTERVQEYMYSKDTTGMSYGEIMRDPAFIAMSQDIQHEIRNSTQQEIDTVNAGLAEIVKLSNPDATPEQITALVGSEFGGLNYEQRILINGTTLSGKVSEAVANGIVEGKTYTEIKRDVKDVYAKAQYATGRLITTEAARAETRSLEEQLKAEGVEEVEVIAESDACEECLALTGKTYSIDDAPEIPVHPNCRCVIRAIVKK